MTAPHNPPAFPNDPRLALRADYQGMTLRDWFAGQAIAAIITATCNGQHHPDRDDRSITDGMAIDAYEIADALLAARDAS